MAQGHRGRWRWTWAAALLAACLALPTRVLAQDDAAPYGVAQHPLEVRALVEPEAVIALLPDELAKARAAGDNAELARLYLAQANACRVVADWSCQRDAGQRAAEAAARVKTQPLQEVRGLIAQARGNIAMQDFTRGEQLLGRAQVLLRGAPSPVLSADVYLA
jgi:hypothetical protein